MAAANAAMLAALPMSRAVSRSSVTEYTKPEFAESLAPLEHKALSIIVIGASGHLARTKTYPAIFALSRYGLLPTHARIIGFARSSYSDEDFREKIRGKLKGSREEQDAFLARCSYFSGQYGSEESFVELAARLTEIEAEYRGPDSNRLFYFAIPPSVFADAASSLKKGAMSSTGWNRVVVEKPFGRDSQSSAELSAVLLRNFTESQLYRIDHYLGKEMVQNLMILRFGNAIFEPLWNRQHVANVMITFKEDVGVVGRGGYFDQYGIIRDVMQNHLLQIMSLVAMEPPVTMDAEDIRDEKVKVLRAIEPLTMDDIIVGQYAASADGEHPAYRDDESVPDDSITPTFALAVLKINSPRWAGVPFILKCGKGLNERKAEVRVQFRPFPGQGLYGGEDALPHNELVLRVQPNEAIYMKMNGKQPGLTAKPQQMELDLTYHKRFKDAVSPEAYERLLLDVLRNSGQSDGVQDRGHHSLFVRADELEHAWKIFTPVLHKMEQDRIEPVKYPFGARSPVEADDMVRELGVQRYVHYDWDQDKQD